eukprot:gene9850-771_t
MKKAQLMERSGPVKEYGGGPERPLGNHMTVTLFGSFCLECKDAEKPMWQMPRYMTKGKWKDNWCCAHTHFKNNHLDLVQKLQADHDQKRSKMSATQSEWTSLQESLARLWGWCH